MQRKFLAALVAVLLIGLVASPAAARSIISMPPVIPRPAGPPEIRLESVQVQADVDQGVARVRVDQRFVNHAGAPAEGTYLFPLPPGASVSSFQMFVDGQAFAGEVLDADKAREVYEGIVRRNRDPALLQSIGQGLLQARIFPVPPGGERQIRVEYSQVLPREAGLWEFAMPLGSQAVPKAAITVNLAKAGPTVYSPTHEVSVLHTADGSARVSYEGSGARGDFRLLFGKASTDMAVTLLSYRATPEDGYFLLLAAPPSTSQVEVVSKDVLLVLDLSGSMAGPKFDQAKGAAVQILGALSPDDRFAVIGFHSDTTSYAPGLRSAAEASEAMAWVESLRLGGSTNIDAAMALAQRLAGSETGRPQVIIMLTDGQPTVGEQDPDRIVASVRSRSTASQRIFTFGVGFDVNTKLLDAMAQENRGRSDYTKPGENVENAVAGLWRKVGQPVLSDLQLQWQGVQAEEVYPHPMPDLYLGSQLMVLGRYRRGGEATLTISGKVNGEPRSFTFDGLGFSDQSTQHDYIPRIWANRKVGYLLGEIRLHGANKEAVDEVVTLAQRFGIVTPYTSFFVNEPTGPSVGGVPVPTPAPGGYGSRNTDGQAAQKVEAARAAAPSSGSVAVEASKQLNQIRDAQSLAQTQPQGAAADQVRTAGDKTFLLQRGVWVDTAYTGGALTYLNLGSDRYLEAVRTHADLARYFAVGTPLIVSLGTWSFGVDIPGNEESPASVQPPLPPAPRSRRGGPPVLWLGLAGGLTTVGAALWASRRVRSGSRS